MRRKEAMMKKASSGADAVFQVVRRVGQFELIKHLNPSRQKLMRQVFEHPRDYVLLSARQLAGRLERDSATLIRTVRAMGFRSYREFQHYLHELSVAHATPLDLMQTAVVLNSNLPAYARESLDRDSKNLHLLRQNLDFMRVLALVRKLYSARQILILGGDHAASLADYLQYSLSMIGLPALSAMTPGHVVHASRNVTRNDVVIGITFGRGLRQTAEGLKQARRNGAYCVGIADTLLSPLAQNAHEFFMTSTESPSFAGSYVAPLALLNVLLVTCANYRRARTIAQLKKAEEEQRTGFRWCIEE